MSPSGPQLIIACLALAGSAATVASDEPVEDPAFEEPLLLTPLDARVDDVSPLSTSFKVEYPGLEMPSGFSSVYRVPGDPDRMMRVNGGLRAIFSQSVYQSSAFGSFPLIPASTIFQIGESAVLPEERPVSEKQTVESPDYEGMARAGFGYVPDASPRSDGPATESSQLPRFVTDADYRRRRLAEILRAHVDSDSPDPDASP